MLIHKYICDRCGQEIKDDFVTIELKIKFRPRYDNVDREQELCEKCSDDFFKFINNKEANNGQSIEM